MSLLPSSTLLLFNAPPTTDIYTLSLHDALPICPVHERRSACRFQHPVSLDPGARGRCIRGVELGLQHQPDRKSTRLNSSHVAISYAVFCLKKKKIIRI